SRTLTSCMVLFICLASPSVFAQKKKTVEPPKPIFTSAGGQLNYTADEQGNRIPDFSYSGYMAGAFPIPEAIVKVVVPLTTGDATERIQAALNYVAALPLGKNGLRGAVLLEKGVYTVAGSLKIKASGVVLRGSGMANGGTLIQATGLDRMGVVLISGEANRQQEQPVAITNDYVPVNAMSVKVANAGSFKTGNRILIHRPSPKNWLEDLGVEHFGGGVTATGWKAGQRDLYWDRTIVKVSGTELFFDAPITTALEARYGGANVIKYSWTGRIAQSGVENLKIQSSYDKNNPKDEYHRWTGVSIANVEDAWVRQVVFENLAGSAVNVQESARRITVEDCKSLAPVSEIGGERRYTFFTTGQQTLFQRLYAEYGYHDFGVGFCAAGPNAFVQCNAYLPFSFSGAIDSWASGVLFDVVNVDGQALSFSNRGQDGQGAGWAAANSVFWQSTAARIDNFKPPGAQNWAFGNWAQFSGDGYWDMSNEQIQPRSLYYAQLTDRIGKDAQQRAFMMFNPSEASSSPSVDVAQKLTKLAAQPMMELDEFIDASASRNPIALNQAQAKTIDQIGIAKMSPLKTNGLMAIENGWLMRNAAVISGNRQEVQWWNGSARPHGLKTAKPHVTRFVPGRAGLGLTDDLNALTDSMQKGSVKVMEHNYGLWYDRRRDDHERIRRMNGEVWAPFYELPFARSGQGTAWDGLSKYDLSKYNLWYWDRLKQFADLADQKGLVLVHQNYFQHNIIEAGAHYADFPWRTANNINSTGFPEPVPYAGDKRIFLAEQFYDISNATRRSLHRAYIRQCLNNFAENNSVIQLIGAEFTGPKHFVEFWLACIEEWKKDTGKHPIIGLSVTKDVQDAILADPEKAALVDVIDIRYWHYQADGTAYAPLGGQNLAPRQHARLLKPQKTSFAQVYRAVVEYKTKYPAKAVIYSGDNYTSYGWAVLMAGGSLPTLPALHKELFAAAAQLKPVTPIAENANQYALANPGKAYIFYNAAAQPLKVDLSQVKGTFSIKIINPANGAVLKTEKVKGGSIIQLQKLSTADEVVLVNKI
ncbi:DUF6298 domain-containing protein, partial [Pedobacter sp.]|uniref:DUF6298 domain-containing protein n=1 Tax=Pedobacter sp. TaxID=1411316 RepID=UPI003D7F4C75